MPQMRRRGDERVEGWPVQSHKFQQTLGLAMFDPKAKRFCSNKYTLTPINMEPDVRGVLEAHFPFKGPVRFHVICGWMWAGLQA